MSKMEDDQLADLSDYLLSFKQSSYSFKRILPFVNGWKRRFFQLSPVKGLLTMNSTRYGSIEIALHRISVENHHYSGEGPHVIVLNVASENGPGKEMEIQIQFVDDDELVKWKQALTSAINRDKAAVERASRLALETLRRFLRNYARTLIHTRSKRQPQLDIPQDIASSSRSVRQLTTGGIHERLRSNCAGEEDREEEDLQGKDNENRASDSHLSADHQRLDVVVPNLASASNDSSCGNYSGNASGDDTDGLADSICLAQPSYAAGEREVRFDANSDMEWRTWRQVGYEEAVRIAVESSNSTGAAIPLRERMYGRTHGRSEASNTSNSNSNSMGTTGRGGADRISSSTTPERPASAAGATTTARGREKRLYCRDEDDFSIVESSSVSPPNVPVRRNTENDKKHELPQGSSNTAREASKPPPLNLAIGGEVHRSKQNDKKADGKSSLRSASNDVSSVAAAAAAVVATGVASQLPQPIKIDHCGAGRGGHTQGSNNKGELQKLDREVSSKQQSVIAVASSSSQTIGSCHSKVIIVPNLFTHDNHSSGSANLSLLGGETISLTRSLPGFLSTTAVGREEQGNITAEGGTYESFGDDKNSARSSDVPSSYPPTSRSLGDDGDPPLLKDIRVSGSGMGLWHIPVPKMQILMMAVGTRGDIQPYAAMALRLKADGHRVRLATHNCFREFVTSCGLEFYPLAGDPHVLSEFMVKTSGFLIPTSSDLLRDAQLNMNMTFDIMHSCWNACVDDDPEGPELPPFLPDAIISNPVTYGHLHCAEALGIPLHLMFPQPWIPTKAFPHPLSMLSYRQPWSTENYLSYQIVDSLLWISMERAINHFRKSRMGLPPVRMLYGEGGWNMLVSHRVPFAKMWSPSLVPRPKDWPDFVDIVGSFADTPLTPNKPTSPNTDDDAVDKEVDAVLPSSPSSNSHRKSASSAASPDARGETLDGANSNSPAPLEQQQPESAKKKASSNDYEPQPELAQFLASGPSPIFVGFGSMVIEDPPGFPSLLRILLEGAAVVGARVLVQAGWSGITQEQFLVIAREAQAHAVLAREAEFDEVHELEFEDEKEEEEKEKDEVREEPSEEKDRGEFSTEVQEQGSDVGSSASESSGKIHVEDKGVQKDRAESSEVTYTSLSEMTGNRDPEATSATKSGGPASNSGSWIGSISNLTAYLYPATAAPKATEATAIGASTSAKEDATKATRRSSAAGSTKSSGKGGDSAKATAHAKSSTKGKSKNAAGTNKGKTLGKKQAPGTLNKILASANATVANWNAETDAILIGPCPHSWLFTRVAAVVHHGGAGTTAAGLRAGRPTWVCPFFGDQFFWGEIVRRSYLGPEPCPVVRLTLHKVADSLNILLGDSTRQAAAEISEILKQEDGVSGAIESFYKRLPLQSMLCEVSIFMGESRLAQVYCKDCDLRMCRDVAARIHRGAMGSHTLAPCCFVDWRSRTSASVASASNSNKTASAKGKSEVASVVAAGSAGAALDTAGGVGERRRSTSHSSNTAAAVSNLQRAVQILQAEDKAKVVERNHEPPPGSGSGPAYYGGIFSLLGFAAPTPVPNPAPVPADANSPTVQSRSRTTSATNAALVPTNAPSTGYAGARARRSYRITRVGSVAWKIADEVARALYMRAPKKPRDPAVLLDRSQDQTVDSGDDDSDSEAVVTSANGLLEISEECSRIDVETPLSYETTGSISGAEIGRAVQQPAIVDAGNKERGKPNADLPDSATVNQFPNLDLGYTVDDSNLLIDGLSDQDEEEEDDSQPEEEEGAFVLHGDDVKPTTGLSGLGLSGFGFDDRKGPNWQTKTCTAAALFANDEVTKRSPSGTQLMMLDDEDGNTNTPSAARGDSKGRDNDETISAFDGSLSAVEAPLSMLLIDGGNQSASPAAQLKAPSTEAGASGDADVDHQWGGVDIRVNNDRERSNETQASEDASELAKRRAIEDEWEAREKAVAAAYRGARRVQRVLSALVGEKSQTTATATSTNVPATASASGSTGANVVRTYSDATEEAVDANGSGRQIQRCFPEECIGGSRRITIDDFAKILDASCASESSLQEGLLSELPGVDPAFVRRSLLEMLSRRQHEQVIEFVDFSLFFLDIQGGRQWKNLPSKTIG